MDELDHKLRQSDARLAESDAKLARLVGRVEAHFDHLAEDPVHRELLRARAWLRHDPSLVVTRDGDAVKGVPEGWPETVSDPDEHVAADVATRRDAYVERTFGQRQTETPAAASASPSVERFRQMVGYAA